MKALDESAQEMGVAPLSTFGFDDDMAGETVVWHDSEKGLVTVVALLEALRAYPERVRKPEQVIVDLKRIEHALRRASDQGIRFCLLIRFFDATNSMEWERRQGTAF